jgi:LPXTG-motif cell wall-anchored protein
MKVDGVLVLPGSSYRVTVNNFLSTGGDGFGKLLGGTNLVGGPQDIDALESYLLPSLGAGPDFAPPLPNRILAFTGPVPVVAEASFPVLLPIAGVVLMLGGGAFVLRRRRGSALD